MADHQIPCQPPNHLVENPFVRPDHHRPHEHVQPERRVANPYVVGRDDQQDFQRDGIPQATGNVALQGQMSHPYLIDAPHRYATQHHPQSPPQPYPEPPYMHMHRDMGAGQVASVQAQVFAPEVFQEYHDGYGARFPAADLPEASPGIWPHAAPLANMPPQNGLRTLAGRYINNPDSLVNMIRIRPGPGGHFEPRKKCVPLPGTSICRTLASFFVCRCFVSRYPTLGLRLA
ncbi:hypothetical protein V8E53_011086 [Lactarius tabidus]